jgi:sugar phosphate isomerase/epimerase
MIQSAVTIALVPQIKTGPWIFWNDLESSMAKAAELGFDAIELFTASADAINPQQLQDLLSRYNLKLAAVGTGAGKVIHGLTLTDPDPTIRRKAISFILEMIDFGAEFGAPAIIGSMQGHVLAQGTSAQSLSWLSEGLEELGEQALLKDVFLIYEPLNRYETNLLNTLQAASEFVDGLQTKGVKLLADLFHMNIEETDLAKAIVDHGRNIGHVHFADSNRKPIGFGHTSMEPIALALRRIDYQGYVSAEAFPWPDPDAAAAQTITAFQKYFSQ